MYAAVVDPAVAGDPAAPTVPDAATHLAPRDVREALVHALQREPVPHDVRQRRDGRDGHERHLVENVADLGGRADAHEAPIAQLALLGLRPGRQGEDVPGLVEADRARDVALPHDPQLIGVGDAEEKAAVRLERREKRGDALDAPPPLRRDERPGKETDGAEAEDGEEDQGGGVGPGDDHAEHQGVLERAAPRPEPAPRSGARLGRINASRVLLHLEGRCANARLEGGSTCWYARPATAAPRTAPSRRSRRPSPARPAAQSQSGSAEASGPTDDAAPTAAPHATRTLQSTASRSGAHPRAMTASRRPLAARRTPEQTRPKRRHCERYHVQYR